MRAPAAFLLFCGLLPACSRKADRDPWIPNAPDASAAPVAPATPDESPKPAPVTDANLLALVPARVAVSSTVDNPKDFPEHLMDGRPETAWNSRTGDLVGGWFAFRVPKDAHVDAIQMTVGFDKANEKLDLFTANHRIKRVRVSKDGKALKEATLDVDKRTLQTIPIDDAGGDYKVEVLETVPGTKKEWKELTVSELRVAGKPGKELRKASDPLRVGVGSLDAAVPKIPPEQLESAIKDAQKDVATLCAVWQQWAAPQWDTFRKDDFQVNGFYSHLRSKFKAPFCREVPFKGTFKGDATWKSVRAVRKGYGPFDGQALVVETARGFVLTSIEWDEKAANVTGCPSVFVADDVPEVRVESGRLFAFVDGTVVGAADGPTGEPDDDGLVSVLVRGAAWCTDDGKALSCEEYNPQYETPLAVKRQPKRHTRVPWSAMPWKETKTFAFDAAGKLVVN